MRRLLLLATFSIVSLGIVHCSGSSSGDDDDSNGADASNDATTNDAGDGSSPNEAGSTDAGEDAAPPPNDSCIGHTDCPSTVENGNLALWLRGNIGVTCAGGRVSEWADQSAFGNNATAGTTEDASVALAPQCGVTKINTHDVVSFTAPNEPDGGTGGEFTQYVDETMDLNLSFVNGSEYTFFIVHRRASDTAGGLVGQDFSIVPGGGLVLYCFATIGSPFPQKALSIEYQNLQDGGQGLQTNDYCTTSASVIDTYQPSQLVIDEAVFSKTAGHAMFTNGTPIFVGDKGINDLQPLANTAVNGVLGRSYNRYSSDTRYKGEIAEIIGYNLALSGPDRSQIEAYLKRQWGLAF